MADDAAAPEGELTESTGTELTESPAEASESPQDTTPKTETTPDAADADAETEVADFDAESSESSEGGEATTPAPKRTISHVTLATIVGLVVVVALGGVVGWLGWRANESRHADQQRDLFLQVGRQAAINLTTIDFTDADAAVQRILDSATDTFYDDFSKRSAPFTEVVKQAQSKSAGEVTAAGIESADDESAQVLVAVTVKTSNAGAPEQSPRMWRMRITVKNTGPDEAKVSNVEFVP
ncbi:tetratricopeptide repeat protein [Mycobacterium sp. ACS4331]|uniref:tetratricopeptide repeat protein n=1 Tax=Mycobacterium sp. ACS4331 TaxID=1834121 RepID=UPI0007FDC5DE|nr:tetratricopeptide repeat protein [Mycobacterium sp. ACS4331]OBF30124.1 Mce protein [Mycobacterium sp. ACS4331]